MVIRNLSQLKKTLLPGVKFEIVLYKRPECVGQIRRVTKVNTSSFYSIITSEPDNKANAANGGLGLRIKFGPAEFWTFETEGLCAKYSDFQYIPNDILIAFKVLEVKNEY